MKTPVCFVLLFLSGILGCENKNDQDPNSQPEGHIEEFISLTSEKDSLYPGESTIITARVDGEYVQYAWEATQGDLLGSGRELSYVAMLCDCGKSRITCTATAGSYKISRNIIIYILDE